MRRKKNTSNDIPRKLRYQLQIRNLTMAKFIKQSQIPRITVENVIYGRSEGMEVMQRIADALELPLNYFIVEPQAKKALATTLPAPLFNARSDIAFDKSFYDEIFEAAMRIIQEAQALPSKEQLEQIAHDAYLYTIEQSLTSQKEKIATYTHFLKGMIHFGMKTGVLRLKS